MALSCAVCHTDNRPVSFFCAQCGTKLHFMEVPQAQLIVMSRSGRGKQYVVNSRICYVGRDDTNQVAIDDDALSKKHAKIVYAAGQYCIEDLASSNGTFVNGERVVSRAALKDGDLIRLGLLILKFSFPTVASTSESTSAGKDTTA